MKKTKLYFSILFIYSSIINCQNTSKAFYFSLLQFTIVKDSKKEIKNPESTNKQYNSSYDESQTLVPLTASFFFLKCMLFCLSISSYCCLRSLLLTIQFRLFYFIPLRDKFSIPFLFLVLSSYYSYYYYHCHFVTSFCIQLLNHIMV